MELLVSLALPHNLSPPGRAREALRDDPQLDAIRDDAILVVSELVTDAVNHSEATHRGLLTLNVVLEVGGRVRIQVHDSAGTDVMPRLCDFAATRSADWACDW
jgi:hypothetical protein